MNESTTVLNSAYNRLPKSMFICAPPIGGGAKIGLEMPKFVNRLCQIFTCTENTSAERVILAVICLIYH